VVFSVEVVHHCIFSVDQIVNIGQWCVRQLRGSS
jgi:hypothetical protein